jgi:hypothetical protein
MRHASFAETKEQVRNKSKTVTRRLGWRWAKVGMLLLPVDKCMGFKKGEHPVILQCPIRIHDVFKEELWKIKLHPYDCAKEGFPELTDEQFIIMFCRINRVKKCTRSTIVTRIEFEYIA